MFQFNIKHLLLIALIVHVFAVNFDKLKKEFEELEAYAKLYVKTKRTGIFALFCFTLLLIGSPFVLKKAREKRRKITGYYTFQKQKKAFVNELSKDPETTIINSDVNTIKKYLDFDQKYALILKEIVTDKANKISTLKSIIFIFLVFIVINNLVIIWKT